MLNEYFPLDCRDDLNVNCTTGTSTELQFFNVLYAGTMAPLLFVNFLEV